MNDRRWQQATQLVDAIHLAEKAATLVRLDGLGLRGRDGTSHPTEDEARGIEDGLRAMRKVAARIAEREASS